MLNSSSADAQEREAQESKAWTSPIERRKVSAAAAEANPSFQSSTAKSEPGESGIDQSLQTSAALCENHSESIIVLSASSRSQNSLKDDSFEPGTPHSVASTRSSSSAATLPKNKEESVSNVHATGSSFSETATISDSMTRKSLSSPVSGLKRSNDDIFATTTSSPVFVSTTTEEESSTSVATGRHRRRGPTNPLFFSDEEDGAIKRTSTSHSNSSPGVTLTPTSPTSQLTDPYIVADIVIPRKQPQQQRAVLAKEHTEKIDHGGTMPSVEVVKNGRLPGRSMENISRKERHRLRKISISPSDLNESGRSSSYKQKEVKKRPKVASIQEEDTPVIYLESANKRHKLSENEGEEIKTSKRKEEKTVSQEEQKGTKTAQQPKFSRELCNLYQHLIDSGVSKALLEERRPRHPSPLLAATSSAHPKATLKLPTLTAADSSSSSSGAGLKKERPRASEVKGTPISISKSLSDSVVEVESSGLGKQQEVGQQRPAKAESLSHSENARPSQRCTKVSTTEDDDYDEPDVPPPVNLSSDTWLNQLVTPAVSEVVISPKYLTARLTSLLGSSIFGSKRCFP